ncbi:MAG: QueT transporter family protein, partial [Candidatus Bathyarchaeia archaeon]
MKIKVRTLALTVLCAASYAGLVYSLAPISFMLIQVRVANALIGLVPILGLPAVYGVTLGI